MRVSFSGLAALAVTVFAHSAALGQSSPNFSYGQVPTAAQWNNAFSKKQDILPFAPLSLGGGALTGRLATAPSSAGAAKFAMPPGVAPTLPASGDMWATSVGFFGFVNNTVIQFAAQSSVTAETNRAQTAEATKAPIASPIFTGTATMPNVTLTGAGSTGDASNFWFTTPAAGGAYRTLLDKFSERLSVKDPQYGAKGDGTTDDGPAIQKAINACNGCTIDVPVGTYRIATPLVGKGGIRFRGQSSVGTNLHASPIAGSILSNASTGPLITFPGSSNLIANDASAWSFEAMTLQGNNLPYALIYIQEANPGRGTWSARINNTLFDGGRPAIRAENTWDTWIDGSSFQRCGDQNVATGGALAGLTESCIYVYNSSQTYTGAGSNSWRVTNSFFDITHGRGIVSDATGPGIPWTGNVFTGNHFGPTGNESIYGCFSGSTFTANFSEGSTGTLPIVNLFAPNSRGSCGSNTFSANTFNTPGGAVFAANGSGDDIIGNIFQGNPGSGGWVTTTSASFINTFRANKTVGPSGVQTIPMVLNDLGSGNTFVGNYSTDNKVANFEEPMRQDGAALWGQLSPQSGLVSYTPTVTCGSGTITTLGTVVARYKQIGKLAFVSVRAPITTNGTCASSISTTLPPGMVSLADSVLGGREAAGGVLLSASTFAGGNTIYMTKYDGTYPGFNGSVMTASGWVQLQ